MIARYEDEIYRLSELIDRGIKSLVEASREVADTEHAYRKAKAIAWVNAPSGLAAARDAWVEAETADEKRSAELAEGMRMAALEAARSRRQQLSAIQSLLAAHKAEAEYGRTRPE